MMFYFQMNNHIDKYGRLDKATTAEIEGTLSKIYVSFVIC